MRNRNANVFRFISLLGLFLMALVLHVPNSALAQDGIRNSIAGDAAADQRRIQQENLPYTIKSGDFRLLITPSLELDYNDNVNVSDQNPQQDFILRPFLGP